ncbi:MAG: GNAT family N-acetyltransferase [Woeseiaceae bacterium]
MSDLEISLDLNPTQSDLDRLVAGLKEHSDEFTATSGFEPIAVFARDSGELVAGASGYINWNWLNVSLLWVSTTQRGTGLGAQLLSRIEDEAVRRGCTDAHLSTFSFQAQAFYEAHEYECFAELPDYPTGHRKVFLRKRLTTR